MEGVAGSSSASLERAAAAAGDADGALLPGGSPPDAYALLPWLASYRAAAVPTDRRRYELVKRCLDLAVVAASLPLLAPLLLVCAIATKLENPRAPVIFRQLRTGRDGRRFELYKFRTMVPEAERLKETLLSCNERRWPDFKLRDDPRVTALGRVLRRASMDELPQLLNVLRGDMTLVGPRPTSFTADTYAPWQRGRLAATPGLTGLWQISRRGDSDFDERVRLDLVYLEHRCLRLDLEILLRTIPVVLRGDRGSW